MAYHACKSYGRYHGLTGATIPPRRLFMVPLIAAAMLGVSQPVANADFDPPGPVVWTAGDSSSDFFCQISQVFTSQVFKLPELGGLFRLATGEFAMGTDDARFTGLMAVGGTEFRFAVDWTGAKPADPNTVDHLVHCGTTTNEWIQFTGTSGELVGLPGSVFDGARYAITKRGNDAQFGIGANTHNTDLGGFSRIFFELSNPLEHPNLSVGPFEGEVSFDASRLCVDRGRVPIVLGSCFPAAEPDLTGTWTGTIDCVGFDAEAGPDATPVENFFSAATLEIGRSSNALDVGDQYSVRLTREAGNAQSFCAYAPNDPGSTTGGQGVLVEPHRQSARVHFKFEGETLKARELIADGLHGTQLCKWSFTRTSTMPPTVADACSPLSCVSGNLCDDNAVCGQGPDCQGAAETCTCADGFVGDDDICSPAP